MSYPSYFITTSLYRHGMRIVAHQIQLVMNAMILARNLHSVPCLKCSLLSQFAVQRYSCSRDQLHPNHHLFLRRSCSPSSTQWLNLLASSPHSRAQAQIYHSHRDSLTTFFTHFYNFRLQRELPQCNAESALVVTPCIQTPKQCCSC